jgi:hypothetical protein
VLPLRLVDWTSEICCDVAISGGIGRAKSPISSLSIYYRSPALPNCQSSSHSILAAIPLKMNENSGIGAHWLCQTSHSAEWTMMIRKRMENGTLSDE